MGFACRRPPSPTLWRAGRRCAAFQFQMRLWQRRIFNALFLTKPTRTFLCSRMTEARCFFPVAEGFSETLLNSFKLAKNRVFKRKLGFLCARLLGHASSCIIAA